jgi:DNA-binding response OmpR family regulator
MATYPDDTKGLKLISRAAGAPAVDLASLSLPLVVLDNVAEDVAKKMQVLALRLDRGHLFIAVVEPNDARLIDEIAFLSGKKVVTYAAHPDQLRVVIDQAYAAKRAGQMSWRGPKAAREQDTFEVVPIDQVAGDSLMPILRTPEPLRKQPTVREPFVGEPSYRPQPPANREKRERPRILVCDDEAVIVRIVQQAFSQRGWEVVTADSGIAALKLIKSSEPDAVLLDAQLPDVHGFEVCKRLKASQRYAHIPVLMMTAVYKGWRMAADLKESYGVVATVEKPIDLQTVVRLIEETLAGRDPASAPNTDAMSGEAQRLFREGQAAYKRNDLDTAVTAMAGAVAIDPLSAPLRHQLGLLYAQKGQDFAAMHELESAVDLDPTRYQTLRNLAILYQRHGFRRKSSELWERALAHAPNDTVRQEIRSLLVQLL